MGRATKKTLVTPEMAEEMLTHMVRNRTIRDRKVMLYATSMLDSTFRSEESISFNQRGELVDGQHRLQAIIKTGTPQYFYIDTDVPNDTKFDIGTPRSVAQSIYMSSDLSKELAADKNVSTIRSYISFKYNNKVLDLITQDQYKQFLVDYESEILESGRIARMGANQLFCRASTIRAVIFAAIRNGESIGRLEEFTTTVNSGMYSGERDKAAVKFRNMLISKSELHTHSAGGVQVTAVAEYALHDFLIGKSIKKAYPIPSIETCRNIKYFIVPCDANIRWDSYVPKKEAENRDVI